MLVPLVPRTASRETIPTVLPEAGVPPDGVAPPGNTLLADIRALIANGRERVAVVANAEISQLYWRVGKRINEEILGNERAEYGKQVIINLARQLTAEYGRGWSDKHLRHCVNFALVFKDEQIVYTLCRQLIWSHIRMVLFISDPLKRDFYIEMCRLERWTVRTLRERIDSALYERTAISKKPDETVRLELDTLRNEKKMTPDLVFRDPYFLDFLGLRNAYSEKDLEDAILSELQQFITEFGTDFAFLARQKRITVDNEDYYIDLLFFHRGLRCLVAIDLKLGKFRAEHNGQMELYLRWLEENEMRHGEAPPIGLILCADKNDEHVRLLRLEEHNIRVASYLTELPEKSLLEKKLALAIECAKQRFLGDAK